MFLSYMNSRDLITWIIEVLKKSDNKWKYTILALMKL